MTSSKEDWTPIEQDNRLADSEEGQAIEEENTTQQHVLVEIVSALRVPSMDANSDSDPYVKVMMGNKKIHETKEINNNSNPIWTLETGSLFLIELEKDNEDLDTVTVSFVVMDHNRARGNTALGSVEVKLKDMVNGTGMRKPIPLQLAQEVINFNQKKKRFVSRRTKLVLRYRVASSEEVHFIKTLNTKKTGIFANETFLPPAISTAAKSAGGTPSQITGWGATVLSTQSQIADNILELALQPSEKWIEVGSGTLGRVYLEVIGCHDLPNMDTPTIRNPHNMTDAFCCLIMEDAIVNTSIINDTLFPRWLPNDRRAFVFHVNHPSSLIYIGVFDHDKVNRLGNAMRQQVHDTIGRVLVNISQFRPGILYTLHYPIYLGDNGSEENRAEQVHNGTLIIRLRIEWGDTCRKGNDTMNMLIQGMRIPRENHLAVPHKHDFPVANYTTVGMHDPNKFNVKTLTGHLEEIQSYANEEVIVMIARSAASVILWRGHYEVRCCGCRMRLPLHSMIAFAWGVLVSQNYNRLPSFILFSITWFFLATNEYRRSHPSPWHKCKSFGELMGALLAGSCCGLGSSFLKGGSTIEANNNLPAIEAYNAAIKDRRAELAKQKELAIELQEDEMKKQMEMDASAIETVENIVSGPKDSFMAAMNPLKPILLQVQMVLFNICCYLRIIKSIVLWEENYYPFWIATFSLFGAVLCFFLPWGLILRWVIRVAVWILLGPWMKIVDWLYFGQGKDQVEEKRKMLQDELHKQYQETLKQRMQSQKLKEERVKLKSMLKYMFGKYVTRVPRFRESEFVDYPLPASTAKPFDGPSEADLNIVGQISGQTLTGHMIPARMILEHPFSSAEPKDSTNFLRVWGNLKKASAQEETKEETKEETQGEEKPLLSDKPGKKKKWYGHFPKWHK